MADDSSGSKSPQQSADFHIRSRPRRILLFSGKRKSGKDFVTDALYKRLTAARCKVIKLSGPIKGHFAESLGLDIEQLLSDGKYKERYRLEMVKWGENKRANDYGYFCRAAIDMYNAWDREVWIVSDVRRKTDIRWFAEHFGDACKSIRVVSDESVRAKRGWTFTPGIDDSETECDLDDVVTWDLIVRNDDERVDVVVERILSTVD